MSVTTDFEIHLPDADALDTAGWSETSGFKICIYLIPGNERDDGIPIVVTHSGVGNIGTPMFAWHGRRLSLASYGPGIVGESVHDLLTELADQLVEVSDGYQGRRWNGQNYVGSWTEDAVNLATDIENDPRWNELERYWDAGDWFGPSDLEPSDHELIDEIQRAGSIDDWVLETETQALQNGAHLSGTETYILDRLSEIADDDTIAQLRTDAGAAGDLPQVALCDRALKGDAMALVECARVVIATRAMCD